MNYARRGRRVKASLAVRGHDDRRNHRRAALRFNCKDDGAGEPGEVAELAGAKRDRPA